MREEGSEAGKGQAERDQDMSGRDGAELHDGEAVKDKEKRKKGRKSPKKLAWWLMKKGGLDSELGELMELVAREALEGKSSQSRNLCLKFILDFVERLLPVKGGKFGGGTSESGGEPVEGAGRATLEKIQKLLSKDE